MKKMFALTLAAMMLFGSAAMAATPTDLTTEPAPVVTEEVTEAPAQEATEAPAEEATEALTEELTEAPAQEETETPAEEVTETPEAPAVERSVKIGLVSGSTIYDGDHVGLRAELIGYEDVAYAIQWQVWNAETQSWDDIAGAVTDTLWLDVTESMNGYQYQVLVTIL